jgi:hypothetical protein
MDKNYEKLQAIQEALDQGNSFLRLTSSPEWEHFRNWVEKACYDYERRAHDPANRENGVALARYLEGHAAIHNLLANFDKAIDRRDDLRKEQEELELGITNPSTTTRRR